MAKGDKNKVQNAANYAQGNTAANVGNLRNDTLIPQNQTMWNNYQNATQGQQGDYQNIMNQYQTAGGNVPTPTAAPNVNVARVNPAIANYQRSNELNNTMQGYGEMAKTGGFSDQAQADIRERGISPIRSTYANAMSNINRQRALQGGYAPNAIAATEKMTRTLPGQLADATTNVNAQLAQMVQQGKLAGLGGMATTSMADNQMMNQMMSQNAERQQAAGTSNQNMEMQVAQLKQQGHSDFEARQLAANQQKLAAAGGQASLYSSTPGMASMFGNQVLEGTNQRLSGEQLAAGANQNAVQNQLGAANVPSNFDTGLGRIGKIGKMVGDVATAL